MKWGSSCGNQGLVRGGLDWKNSATSPCGLTHMRVSLEHALGSLSAVSSSAVWLTWCPSRSFAHEGACAFPSAEGKPRVVAWHPVIPAYAISPWKFRNWLKLYKETLFRAFLFLSPTDHHMHPCPSLITVFLASICGFAVLLFYDDPSHAIPSNAKVKLIYFRV